MITMFFLLYPYLLLVTTVGASVRDGAEYNRKKKFQCPCCALLLGQPFMRKMLSLAFLYSSTAHIFSCMHVLGWELIAADIKNREPGMCLRTHRIPIVWFFLRIFIRHEHWITIIRTNHKNQVVLFVNTIKLNCVPFNATYCLYVHHCGGYITYCF